MSLSTLGTKSFRVGRSRTGLGLFATREIKKGARITRYRGPLLDHDTAVRVESRGNRYLFEISDDWTIDGKARSNVARYANHSCNPNAEAYYYGRGVYIRALRRIKPGEEITYHYGMDYLRNVIGIANCRCGRCVRRKARMRRERAAKLKRATARAAKRRRRS
ncbi:MAG: SET domain-containing protein [Pseudolabrys sp.]|nr:SET domain-containing protein [Pseudolabrys sp.]MBV9954495.1 SET domain-containing protein [Pseudolabrys sp.]